VDNVCVYRKPCVAVISSGNEIVAANAAELPAGKVRDINSVLLLSCLQQYGYKTVDMGIIPDEYVYLRIYLCGISSI
jgi:molybdopterin biosynthesis enzyme